MLALAVGASVGILLIVCGIGVIRCSVSCLQASLSREIDDGNMMACRKMLKCSYERVSNSQQVQVQQQAVVISYS